jgi:hypothetical protein
MDCAVPVSLESDPEIGAGGPVAVHGLRLVGAQVVAKVHSHLELLPNLVLGANPELGADIEILRLIRRRACASLSLFVRYTATCHGEVNHRPQNAP